MPLSKSGRTCFVIQPFATKYTALYRDTLKPAIEEAGFTPYRVDHDPDSNVPITDIEYGLRHAEVCLVEITTDSPNIWYELGFALACRKPVALISSLERSSPYPFDVQHRMVIEYDPQNLFEFRERLVLRLRSLVSAGQVFAVHAEIRQLFVIMPDGRLVDDPHGLVYRGHNVEITIKEGFARVRGQLQMVSMEDLLVDGSIQAEGPVVNGVAYLQYEVADTARRLGWSGSAVLRVPGFGDMQGYWMSEDHLTPGAMALGSVLFTTRRAQKNEAGVTQS